MKRWGVLAGIVCAGVLHAGNLVQNGDMSGGEGQPDAWKLYQPKGMEVARDTQTYRSAPASLRMDVSDGGKHSVYQFVGDGLSGKHAVKVSVKAEGEGLKQVQPFVHVMGADWKTVQWLTIGMMRPGDWTVLSKEIDIPAGGGHVQFGVMAEGTGRVWVDDAEVVALDAPPAASAPDASPLDTAVSFPASDPRILTVGRFDRSADGVACAWPASELRFAFKGAGDVGVKIPQGGVNRFLAVVDGVAQPAVKMTKGQTLYPVARGLKEGAHEVSIYKITEAHCGVLKIASLELPKGAVLVAPSARKRKIEVVGDSISCGYGNEAPSKEIHYSPDTENAYLTYGAMVARRFNADYTCVAWSGKKMSPDNTIPALYDRTLPQSESSVWRFDGDVPDALLINLCTNDSNSKTPLDEEKWVADYLAFIQRLRSRAPSAQIYCVIGPMMWGDKLTRFRRLIQNVVQTRKSGGDAKIGFLEFETQKMQNGIGADWHPSVRTHEIMADTWAAAIKADLGW